MFYFYVFIYKSSHSKKKKKKVSEVAYGEGETRYEISGWKENKEREIDLNLDKINTQKIS